jgi:nucleoside-diphosphate-sugar epimerase
MKRILVTGAAGYIGSVLVRQLLEKDYVVRGMDILNFGGESILGIYNHRNFEFMKGDVRKLDDIKEATKEIEGVVHLAAIVGDPACSEQPLIAEETNLMASKQLYDVCNSSPQIEKFIFASTCSNYGKMEGDGFLDETSPLKPISLYAELKVKFEDYLLNKPTREKFTPTALRFATVYGISPRMRFDLTVNEFIKEVALGKELIIFGEQFWRPYCHVEDLARACVCVLEADPETVNHNVYNVGDTNENYQKKMIAEKILEIVPSARIKYVHKNEDPRDYRVAFSKISKELDYSITKRVPDGLREIYDVITNGWITDVEASKYKNS